LGCAAQAASSNAAMATGTSFVIFSTPIKVNQKRLAPER
jgi:hypothetical protein